MFPAIVNDTIHVPISIEDLCKTIIECFILNCCTHAIALWNKFSYDVATRNDKLKNNRDTAFTADGRFTPEALAAVRLPDVSLCRNQI